MGLKIPRSWSLFGTERSGQPLKLAGITPSARAGSGQFRLRIPPFFQICLKEGGILNRAQNTPKSFAPLARFSSFLFKVYSITISQPPPFFQICLKEGGILNRGGIVNRNWPDGCRKLFRTTVSDVKLRQGSIPYVFIA